MKSYLTQLSFLTECNQDVYVENTDNEMICSVRVKESDGEEFRIFLNKEEVKILVEMLAVFKG